MNTNRRRQTVLALGAGPEQLPGILSAQKQGYQVLALDNNPSAVGRYIANSFFSIDISNSDQVTQLAKQHKIKFIIPSPIGKHLVTVGTVNDALKLPGVSKIACETCSDRTLLYQKFRAMGILCPEQKEAKTYQDIRNAIDYFHLPCILRTQRSSGSHGVIAIHRKENISKAVKWHLERRDEGDETLVSRFLKGQEIGLDGVVTNGVFHLASVRDKKMTPLPYRQELALLSPHSLSNEQIESINHTMQKVTLGLGFNDCLLNADIIMHENLGPVILKVLPRPAGYSLASQVMHASIGVNLIDQGIRLLTGKPLSIKAKWQKAVILHFFPLQSGRVLSVPNLSNWQNLKGLLSINLPLIEGQELSPLSCTKGAYDRGFVIMMGDNRSDCEKRTQKVIDQIIESTHFERTQSLPFALS